MPAMTILRIIATCAGIILVGCLAQPATGADEQIRFTKLYRFDTSFYVKARGSYEEKFGRLEPGARLSERGYHMVLGVRVTDSNSLVFTDGVICVTAAAAFHRQVRDGYERVMGKPLIALAEDEQARVLAAWSPKNEVRFRKPDPFGVDPDPFGMIPNWSFHELEKRFTFEQLELIAFRINRKTKAAEILLIDKVENKKQWVIFEMDQSYKGLQFAGIYDIAVVLESDDGLRAEAIKTLVSFTILNSDPSTCLVLSNLVEANAEVIRAAQVEQEIKKAIRRK